MKKRFDAVSEEEIDLVFFLTKMYQWTLSLRVSYIKNSSFYGKRLATVLFRALLEIIGEMINMTWLDMTWLGAKMCYHTFPWGLEH